MGDKEIMQTRVHSTVERAWCGVLDTTNAVDDDDDFFRQGGNSLMAVSFVTQIESALEIQFPLEALFLDGRFGTVVARCENLAVGRG